MVTICKECKHRRASCFLDIAPDKCMAMETKTTSFVTGKTTSYYLYCNCVNLSGNCSYFVDKKEK